MSPMHVREAAGRGGDVDGRVPLPEKMPQPASVWFWSRMQEHHARHATRRKSGNVTVRMEDGGQHTARTHDRA